MKVSDAESQNGGPGLRSAQGCDMLVSPFVEQVQTCSWSRIKQNGKVACQYKPEDNGMSLSLFSDKDVLAKSHTHIHTEIGALRPTG